MLAFSVNTPASATVFSYTLLDRQTAEVAPRSNLLVAEFHGGGCRTIHGRDADQRLAIASTFKLYVLGELARQIQTGSASWSDRIAIDPGLRSMPSGDYAYALSGTRVTVEDFALAMIRDSDNTATDHLIDYLGREEVQRAFASFGHGDADLNAPLLLTREFFAIKMIQSPGWMREFEQANDDQQLAMLEADIDDIRLDPTGGWGNWNGPTAIEAIEWFASAEELCRVTSALWSMGAQSGMGEIREILTASRGGVGDADELPRVGYKGGYEAGVVNMTFVLEHDDGRIFFVSAGYNDPQRVIDVGETRMLLDPLFECLGRASASCMET